MYLAGLPLTPMQLIDRIAALPLARVSILCKASRATGTHS